MINIRGVEKQHTNTNKIYSNRTSTHWPTHPDHQDWTVVLMWYKSLQSDTLGMCPTLHLLHQRQQQTPGSKHTSWHVILTPCMRNNSQSIVIFLTKYIWPTKTPYSWNYFKEKFRTREITNTLQNLCDQLSKNSTSLLCLFSFSWIICCRERKTKGLLKIWWMLQKCYYVHHELGHPSRYRF